jgi:hypothetical protein
MVKNPPLEEMRPLVEGILPTIQRLLDARRDLMPFINVRSARPRSVLELLEVFLVCAGSVAIFIVIPLTIIPPATLNIYAVPYTNTLIITFPWKGIVKLMIKLITK